MAVLTLPRPGDVTAGPLAAVMMLGLLCTAVGWPILFRLVAAIGPTASSMVTFLVPAFGVAWGALFLGEPLAFGTLAGAVVVLVSVRLVLELRWRSLLPRPFAALSGRFERGSSSVG